MDPLHTLLPSCSDIWLNRTFATGPAASGGVVVRQRDEIEAAIGWARFEYELRRRGCRAVIDGPQVLIYRGDNADQIPA
jgi:hypothetical protein